MRVIISYNNITFFDIYDLMTYYGGYFDGDRKAVVLPYNDDLVEELECRGVKFRVEI